MKTRGVLSNVLIVLIIALVVGCTTDRREEEVKGFVQTYCSMLQDAYARADLKLISQFATEKELKKLFPVIQALNATDNSMKTEILQFKVKRAKLSDDKATVQTSEKWRYWWIDKKSGTLTKPKQEESYNLEYNLVKAGGSWKIDFVKNLND